MMFKFNFPFRMEAVHSSVPSVISQDIIIKLVSLLGALVVAKMELLAFMWMLPSSDNGSMAKSAARVFQLKAILFN